MPELKRGVSGVLGGLIGSAAPAPKEPVPVEKIEALTRPVTESRPAKETTGEANRPKARRGRPPGSGNLGQGLVERKKVTLRVKTTLLDEYIEWSWSRRCQLGQLIEEALEAYSDRERRRAAAPKMP